MHSDEVPDTTASFSEPWRKAYVFGQPLPIGGELQFVHDDYAVEDRRGLKRVLGPICKSAENPLDFGEPYPWEESGIRLGHVIYDPQEKLYKAWYVIKQPYQPAIETGHNYSWAYAQSSDGYNWVKPKLGMHSYQGCADTNLVLHKQGTIHMMHVELNPRPDSEQERYLALVKMVPPGRSDRCLVRMHSPDGRHWQLDADPVLFEGASDGSYSLAYDDAAKHWLLYRRPPTRAIVPDAFYSLNAKRHASVCASRNLRDWSYPRSLFLPDELDVSDIDSVTVIRYRQLFFGFLGLMDNAGLEPKQTQLMFSRDGLAWDRLPDRPLFVPNGQPGEWDAGQITVRALVPLRDHIRIYYDGSYLPQKNTILPRLWGTGVATMDKDRFIGQKAGPEGGYLLTRQFVCTGTRLAINAMPTVKTPPRPETLPQIRAELLQPGIDQYPAQAYPGFSLADCDGITVADDTRAAAMSWQGSTDLSPLKGQLVYIRFHLRNTILFTFQVCAE